MNRKSVYFRSLVTGNYLRHGKKKKRRNLTYNSTSNNESNHLDMSVPPVVPFLHHVEPYIYMYIY